MMRTYRRKTTRGFISSQQLNDSAKAVTNEGKCVGKCCRQGIRYQTDDINRFIKKLKSESCAPSMGFAAPRQVFSSE